MFFSFANWQILGLLSKGKGVSTSSRRKLLVPLPDRVSPEIAVSNEFYAPTDVKVDSRCFPPFVESAKSSDLGKPLSNYPSHPVASFQVDCATVVDREYVSIVTEKNQGPGKRCMEQNFENSGL
jgi:hypothetical protein